MSNRNTVTSGDRTRIAYDTFGDGPGIVLVPGALHCGHHYRALADCLADEFTVYCVDRRGRPGSGPQRPDHNIEPECQDLIAVLEKTGASLVFGHSSGGVVALQTALRRPLAKLAVYEPPVSIHGSVPTGFLPDLERAVARAQARRARGPQQGSSRGPQAGQDAYVRVETADAPGKPARRPATS